MTDIIVFPVKDKESYLNVKKLLFDYGFKWIIDNMSPYDDSTYKVVVIRPVRKIITILPYTVEHAVDIFKLSRNMDYNVSIINTIGGLIFKLSGGNVIDYNKPRQLVYENKILKFNEI